MNNQMSITEFMSNDNLSLTTQKRNDLLIMAYDLISDLAYSDMHLSDLPSIASNEHFIYYNHAIDFLNSLDVFDVIGVVMEFEQNAFGETYCDFSDPVNVANAFIFVLIDHILNDFINSTDLDYIETEDDYNILINWIEENKKEIV